MIQPNPHPLRWALGQEIKHLRVQCKLSQATLADRTGYHRTYISIVERGVNSATLDFLLAVSAAFGIRLTHLIQGAERRYDEHLIETYAEPDTDATHKEAHEDHEPDPTEGP